MSARGRHSQRRSGAGSLDRPPGRRRGRSTAPFYFVALAVFILLAGVVGLLAGAWRGGAITISSSSAVAPAPHAVSKAKPKARAKIATASVAATASQAAASSSVTIVPLPSAESARTKSAVEAAAVQFPGAPAVTPRKTFSTNPSRKLVAITLDDGIPFDTRILDLFEQRNIRLTTFLLGQAVQAHPDLVKRLAKDGFEIADHTWDHRMLTGLTDSEVVSELTRTQRAITAITGNQAPYMRPPGGATSPRVTALAAGLGYRVILWDKSFADTSRVATPIKEFHNVMDGLRPGDIILCHWGGRDTYQAMQLILPEMERRGFTPVTISELLKYSPASER
jgi:peptidoglycan-N-acetylglucosamine deacetylase